MELFKKMLLLIVVMIAIALLTYLSLGEELLWGGLFSKKEVNTISKTKSSDILPSQEDKLLIGLKEGYVAIYKKDRSGEKELIKVRKDIPIFSLSSQDIKELQQGIKVKNRRELLSLLEGFASANN